MIILQHDMSWESSNGLVAERISRESNNDFIEV